MLPKCTIYILLAIFLLHSCRSEPYIYDRPGTERTTGRPAGYGQGYRTSPVGYTPAPTYYYTPYAAPTPVPGYSNQGGSRYYNNPYAIESPQRVTPSYYYYDSDQYYVPPTYYYNHSEQSSGAGAKL